MEIDKLKKLSKLRKEIYADSLANKIAKAGTQHDLHTLYKPILESQEATAKEAKTISEKLENTAELRHDVMTKEIKNQPLLIPLIKTLNGHPNVVRIISGEIDDTSILTAREKAILKEVNKIQDDEILRALIDHYTELESMPNPPPYADGDVSQEHIDTVRFATPDRVLANSSGVVYKFDVDRLGLGSCRNVINKTSGEVVIGDDVYKGEMAASLWSLITIPDIRGETYNTGQIHEYLRLLKRYNVKLDERRVKYKSIKAYSSSGQGITKFMSSDPQELVQNLDVLMSEFKAGNTNTFNQISAITDELRRQGILSIKNIKSIFKEISTN